MLHSTDSHDHFLDKLPSKYYDLAFIPLVRHYQPNEQVPNEDKIGGDQPFLGLDETWPVSRDGQPMRFVLQLSVPVGMLVPYTGMLVPYTGMLVPYAGKTIRLFMDDCDGLLSPDNIHVSYIDYTQPYQQNPAPFRSKEKLGPFPAFKVDGHILKKEFNLLAHKELIDCDNSTVLASIFGWQKVREWCDEPFADKEDTEDLPSLPKDYDHSHLSEDILNPPDGVLSRPFTGIKIGGFPTSCQSAKELYIEQGMFLQIGECDALAWYYGDVGEIHINPDTKKVDGDCC